MNRIAYFAGALLIAAPLLFSEDPRHAAADPRIKDGAVEWFPLSDTRRQIEARLGLPRMAADFGDFISLQYQIGEVDTHEYTHMIVLRRSDGSLVSVTRNYEPERLVDEFFPAGQTTVHSYPDALHPQFSLRLRRLPGGRVLMAMGSAKPGAPTGQLVLMKESEVRHFYPWLTEQLKKLAIE